MQAIKIKIIDDSPIIIWGILSYEGIIRLGDFEENIVMPIDYWSRQDYERQWKEGLERIKTQDTSCLVATIQNPETAPLVDWWLLYKENSKIYIQNQILFKEPYLKKIGQKKFTPETCYQFIRSRKTMSEAGKISEWSVDTWW